ncbi:MAG: MFS transporter [Candidatus Paracaedibacter sp.]
METGAIAAIAEETAGKIIQAQEKDALNSTQSWLIWVCAGAFYLYECILRVSPSVMTQGLMSDFSLTSSALGGLVSCYLYAYVVLQVPCGVMVDALGARRIITASAALCTMGAFMFALGDSLIWAQLGRFLIGAGSACAFISCLKVVAEWFTPTKFAVMLGLTNMMGTMGGTFGGPPLAWMVNNLGGWREATMVLAIIGIVVTMFSWLMVRDRPQQVIKPPHHTHEIPLRKSFLLLATNPQVWLIALFGSLMWLPIAAFAELWGVPYLMHTYNIDNEYASFATVMIFVGFACGGPLAAWMSEKFKSRIRTMKLSSALLFTIFLTIVFGPEIPLPLMFALLFVGGVCNGGQVLVFACVKEISPRRISGTALGFTNAIVMMSGVIFQPLLGKLLDWCWDGTLGEDGVRIYSEAAYQTAMIAIPAGLAVSWFLLNFVKETHHFHRQKGKG